MSNDFPAAESPNVCNQSYVPSSSIDPRIEAAIITMKSTRGKRAMEIILAQGSINTEEIRKRLKETHPPRTAGDIKDSGIPLVMNRVWVNVSKTKKKLIGEYSLGDASLVNPDKFGGRIQIPKSVKRTLIAQFDSVCSTCTELGDLTVDHRIPYKVAGNKFIKTENQLKINTEACQLLCRSCNLTKAKCCNSCKNTNDTDVCEDCFWASPNSYQHIAQKKIRRLEIVWNAEETDAYDLLIKFHGNDIHKLMQAMKDPCRQNEK